MAWILQNVPGAAELAAENKLCLGTMDSFLVYQLTEEKAFKTDYSNASRTQLFNIHTLAWDEELCILYGVPRACLPEVCMSDSLFGHTTLGGLLDKPVPLCGVLGDSHAALLGQNCRAPGQTKATYGTGSSVMMQTGERLVTSRCGLVTSLAWGLDGRVEYVLEGNLNYTGAVITWLKKDAAKGQVTVVDRPAADAVPIETRYETMAVNGRLALLRVELITGRTHQIRAHLASVGCPILGDGKYGQNAVNRQLHFKYQALCAWRLTFPSDCPPSLASVNGKCFTLEKPWYCRQLLDGELK